MQVPKCQCSKYVDYKPMETQKYGPENGTCSKESWIRGPGQKVVGKFFGKTIISKQAKAPIFILKYPGI